MKDVIKQISNGVNKKTLIIVILILIILAVLFFAIFRNGKNTVSKLPVISNFFPKSEDVSIPKEELPGKQIKTLSKEERYNLRLLNITEKPIASYVISGSSTVRYLDKAMGHLYETDVSGEKAERLSNTTILNIFDAEWGGANRALIKFLKDEKDIVFFSANFNGSSTVGVFLDNNTKSAAMSPDTVKIAYVVDEKGRGIVFTADANNAKKQQILSLPFADFSISFKNKNELGFLTTPSAFVSGILYSLNIQDKTLAKITEGQGLNILWSPARENIFVSTYLNNKLENKIIALSGGEYFLSIKTFPDKCVWSKVQADTLYCAVPLNLPNGNYPDDWYGGKIDISDALYKINFKTGENQIVAEEINDLKMDIINISLNPDENYLFFMNKKDGLLWRIRLVL